MSGYNYLPNVLGAWSSSIQYSVQSVVGSAQVGLGYVSCPMVSDAGSIWYTNGSAQPTLGTHPANDSAWSLLQTGVTYNVATPNNIFDKSLGNAVWVATTT